ncbi:unnamed protein product, partial [Ceratitis capitata]
MSVCPLGQTDAPQQSAHFNVATICLKGLGVKHLNPISSNVARFERPHDDEDGDDVTVAAFHRVDER